MTRFYFYTHVLYFDFSNAPQPSRVCNRAKPLSYLLDDNGVAEAIRSGVSPSWSGDYCRKKSYCINHLITIT